PFHPGAGAASGMRRMTVMDRYGSTTARGGAGTAARGTGASFLTRLAVGLLTATATVALLLVAPPTPAAAHNRLIDSDPPAGATLAEPPQRVELTFAERLNPSYTTVAVTRSEEHTSELQSREKLVCRLLLEKKKHKEQLN